MGAEYGLGKGVNSINEIWKKKIYMFKIFSHYGINLIMTLLRTCKYLLIYLEIYLQKKNVQGIDAWELRQREVLRPEYFLQELLPRFDSVVGRPILVEDLSTCRILYSTSRSLLTKGVAFCFQSLMHYDIPEALSPPAMVTRPYLRGLRES
jgi:hypothetical protein